MLKSISLISIINQGKTFDTSCTFTRDKWAFDGSPAGCPARGCGGEAQQAQGTLAARSKHHPLSEDPAQWGVGSTLGQSWPGFHIVRPICKSVKLPDGLHSCSIIIPWLILDWFWGKVSKDTARISVIPLAITIINPGTVLHCFTWGRQAHWALALFRVISGESRISLSVNPSKEKH